MDLSSLKHFLAMGGYAAYVWPAYSIVCAVLVTNLVIPIIRNRRLLKSPK